MRKKSKEFRESLRNIMREPVRKRRGGWVQDALDEEAKRQEELLDIQAELEKKFDELFGSLEDDSDDFDDF